MSPFPSALLPLQVGGISSLELVGKLARMLLIRVKT